MTPKRLEDRVRCSQHVTASDRPLKPRPLAEPVFFRQAVSLENWPKDALRSHECTPMKQDISRSCYSCESVFIRGLLLVWFYFEELVSWCRPPGFRGYFPGGRR